MDGGIIVNYEDALVHYTVSAFFSADMDLGDCNGSSNVKDAPVPGPSLKAAREPPISLAASAPLCRPNPCPSRLVVKPCEKMRVRLSGAMPMPLSCTLICTQALSRM